MADFVLIDGDTVNFIPLFTPAIVSVQPGNIEGSGPATIGGKKVCVDGDEANVSIPGCSYFTAQYSIPGSGTLTISALAGNQIASKTNTANKAVLLKGAMFTAKFEVQSPAQQPPPGAAPPVPDSMTEYSGQGMFVNNNTKVKAT
ncbi:MAG: hypothetical protein HRU20_13035 [Pseudomonadales bacterium]|nr:hypothetical protein [Pseudomonadales bacterium]